MILSPQEWKFHGRGEYFAFIFSPGGCSYYVGEDYISHRQIASAPTKKHGNEIKKKHFKMAILQAKHIIVSPVRPLENNVNLSCITKHGL